MEAEAIVWPKSWPQSASVQWLDLNQNTHSRVALVQLLGQPKFLKVYGLPGREDKFSSPAEVERLIVGIELYRSSLRSLGVVTPANYLYGWEQQPSTGSYLLYVLDGFAGRSLQQVLAAENWASLSEWLPRIATMLSGLFRSATDGLVRVGIDPKPSNFVVSEAGQLSYVDLVWPLNDSQLAAVHSDIRSLWQFRYFSKAGILLCWLLNFSRFQLASRRLLIEQIDQFLLAQRDEATRQTFAALPGIAPLATVRELILSNQFPLWNADLLRALAVQLVAEGKITSPEFISQIFDLTRTNPHKPFPMEQVKACFNLLREHIFSEVS